MHMSLRVVVYQLVYGSPYSKRDGLSFANPDHTHLKVLGNARQRRLHLVHAKDEFRLGQQD